MNELSAPRYIMPKSVFSCQHCDEHVKFQILSYTLHDFLSVKVRFIHTSTVTRSQSCSGIKILLCLASIINKCL